MSEVELRSTTINLNAGPSPLPLAALQEAASALLSFTESPGMGIAEISHRSPAFSKVIAAANEDIKLLLQIPDNYRVLWMQGGGLTQFSATVLNLLAWYRLKHQLDRNDEVVAEYAVTGSWSLKAAEEGQRMGAKAKMVIDARKEGNGKFTSIPKLSEWAMESQISNSTQRKPAFIYYCDNETVDGVEFPAVTKDDRQAFPIESIDPEVPIVCDMSSNFLSRPVDISKYGIIYAGAQKNLGPAGVSVIIIREDLLVDTDLAVKFGGPLVPAMLSYKNMADSGSMYNTPPTFTIYLCSLVLRSLLATPPLPLATPSSAPLSPLSEFADRKSSLIYNVIDSDDFYIGTAQKGSRSRMNATFRLKGEGKDRDELEKRFISEASKRGIKGVAGHRSVGGIRTSLYNAVTLEQVESVSIFMKEFRLIEQNK